MESGKLYLIPCAIGEEDLAFSYLPISLKRYISTIDIYIVENIRSARRFLKKAGIEKAIDELFFHEMDKHKDTQDFSVLKQALAGKNIGVISEAGMPAIADPGSLWVKEAHALGIKVVPIPGPSSIFLALAASGFNGQQFSFHGYLPKEQTDRIKKIKVLENQAKLGAAQIFIETPYRNTALFDDLIKHCNGTTMLCVACNLNTEHEFVKSYTISEWKSKKIDLQKHPTVFILGN